MYSGDFGILLWLECCVVSLRINPPVLAQSSCYPSFPILLPSFPPLSFPFSPTKTTTGLPIIRISLCLVRCGGEGRRLWVIVVVVSVCVYGAIWRSLCFWVWVVAWVCLCFCVYAVWVWLVVFECVGLPWLGECVLVTGYGVLSDGSSIIVWSVVT